MQRRTRSQIVNVPRKRGRPRTRPLEFEPSDDNFDFGDTSSSSNSDSPDHYQFDDYSENEKKEAKQNAKPKHTSLFFTATQITTDDAESVDNSSSDENNSQDSSDEKQPPLIQSIVGVKGNDDMTTTSTNDESSDDEKEDANDDSTEYFVKWTGKSYIHCSYVTKKELLKLSGGDNALKKFNYKKKQNNISQSLSIPSLMTLDSDDLSANWFEVDRVIGHDNGKYLVKWRGQGYELSTWENPSDIKDNTAILKYEERLKHSNPIKLHIKENEENEEKNVNENNNNIVKNDNKNIEQNNSNNNKENDPNNVDSVDKENENVDNSDKSANKENEENKSVNEENVNQNKKENENEIPEKINKYVDPKTFQKIDDPLTDSEGNSLRSYQVDGFNWLRYCWYNSINSILADEMGLGKTLQVVATLNDISRSHNICGPFLVVAPLSTLPHWRNEFDRWTTLNAIIYHGSSPAKEIIQRYEMFVYDSEGQRLKDKVQFDVLITNYETFMSDFEIFEAIHWRYLVLDEGHRLKNHTGKCYQMLQQIHYDHCTLLTGTPVQNNVEELWSLLHFLHPNRFGDLSAFLESFGVIEDAETVKQLQELIKPYLLRRKKSDVDKTIAAKEETIIMVELTRIQKTFYRALLHENASVLLQQITGGALPSLLNLMMQLRKVCNHPFLLKSATSHIEEQIAEKLGKSVNDEEVQLRSIVDSSGKLILIDKLLPKLRQDNHKVLIFSQMVKVLDILEEYFALVGIKPERIDGSVPENERQNAIERFAEDPNAFVFLLCTRAGGVGINLTAADTVIIYDSDWNPQNDLQAESRCHRIGQKSKVKVYRLVTSGTYELEMLDRASKKLGLDHAILDGGDINSKQRPMAAKEVEKLLRRGVYNITKDDDSEINNFCSADIDQILVSRTKDIKRDPVSGGDSFFSKAQFNAEKDTLDMNSKDFWAKALPEIKFDRTDEELTERRCKKKSVKFNDLSDDDDDRRRRKKLSSYSNPTPRAIAARIMHQGYTGSAIEKSLLLYAASTEPLAQEDIELLKKILDVPNLKDKTDDVINAEKKFATPLSDYVEKKETLFKRTFFFYQLNQVLTLIQQPVDNWPVSTSGADPMIEYAILYGINKNGLGQSSRVFEGVSLDGMSPFYTDKSIQKISRQLVTHFLGEAQLIDRFPKNYSDPKEWKEDHMNLFNREEITDEELTSLFQTLTLLGFPFSPEGIQNDESTTNKNENNSNANNDNNNNNNVSETNTNNDDTNIDNGVSNNSCSAGEILWGKVRKYSNLTCISIDTIIEKGQLFLDLAEDRLDIQEAKHVIQKLGPYGNKVWVTRLKSNAHDLKQIRQFLLKMTEKEKEKLSKVKYWDAAPNWWTPDHDFSLLQVLAEHGITQTSVWITDPNFPFAEKIPVKLKDDFFRSASLEKTKFRPQKPKDAGELNFLYNDKSKISRANYILSAVYSEYEGYKSDDDENNEDDEILYTSEFSELPKMPIECGNTLTICDLGKFETVRSVYPIGFKCNRQYFSIKDPSGKSWYEGSTVLNGNGELRFVVKHLAEPEKTFSSNTSSGVWEQVIQEVQKARGRAGLTKRKHTTVSGPFMFGFSHTLVMSCFKLMKSYMNGGEIVDDDGEEAAVGDIDHHDVKKSRSKSRNASKKNDDEEMAEENDDSSENSDVVMENRISPRRRGGGRKGSKKDQFD